MLPQVNFLRLTASLFAALFCAAKSLTFAPACFKVQLQPRSSAAVSQGEGRLVISSQD